MTDHPRTRFIEMAPDVYAVLGSNGMPNAAVIDGRDDGVVIVDSRFTPAYAREMLEAVGEVTPAPVVALINTHFHCDHTFGNPVIPTDRIIAHQRALAKLEELGDGYIEELSGRRPDLAPELAGVRLRLPNETIGDDGITLALGDMTLEVRYAGGPAHTDHDLTIRIPERRAFIAADLVFNEVTPFLHGGDLYGWREAVKRLPREGIDVVLPGHGELGGTELYDAMLAFFDGIEEEVRAAIGAGGGLDEARARSFARFGHLLFAAQRLPESVEQAYHHVIEETS